MKTGLWLRTGCVMAVAALAGCIESTTVLTVAKDGSGTITLDEYFSPQITGMMSGAGAMFGEMMADMADAGAEAGAEAGKAPGASLDEMLLQSAEKRAAALGTGVRLVSKETRTNGDGWKGYHAVYAFDDVGAVRLGIGGMEMGDAESEGGRTSSEPQAAYSFVFTPGDVAELKLVPAPAGKDAGSGRGDAGDGGDDEDDEDLPPQMAQMGDAMIAMMEPMLKGMRTTFIVKVGGEIVETNAKLRSKDSADTVYVLQVPVDKLLAHKPARALLSSNDEEDRAALAAMEIPGVLMEPPDKTIVVTFR